MAVIYVPRVFGGTIIFTITPQAPPQVGIATLGDGLRGSAALLDVQISIASVSDVKIGDVALIDQG